MSETLNKTDDVPAHPNFVTLQEFADMRDSAPTELRKDIGSSVLFLYQENGTLKILNGVIQNYEMCDRGMFYDVIMRDGRVIEFLHHARVIAV